MAFSKDTGLFYVPSNEWGMDIWNEPVAYKSGAAYLGAGFTIKPRIRGPHRLAEGDRPELGQDRLGIQEQGPAVGWRADDGGGLVFFGTPEGYLKALDAKTGKELWKFNTGSGIVGRRSPGKRTASSSSPLSRVGVARSRCGAARLPSPSPA